MTKYVVGTVDEIPPGGRKVVEIARRSVGVFNVNGRFYAIRDQCPHAGGPLCEGVLSGLTRSDSPGNYEYVRQGEMLRCPWHGWEFDITTGHTWIDPARTKVRAYVATVESARDLGATTTDLVAAGYEPGPYTAEIYDVEVDRDFVVVHI